MGYFVIFRIIAVISFYERSGVLNLLKNVIEYVCEIDNEIEKTIKIEMYNKKNAIVTSTNNKGEPVPPEKFNFDRTMKKVETGLGTTYAYLVTKAHGGEESSERKDTTVMVKLYRT